MIVCSNMIKLIVCDIDGTLTRDGSIYPSEYTIDVLNKAHEKGIYFGVASGRDVFQLKEFINEWNLNFEPELIIGLNGSEYYDALNDIENRQYQLQPEDIKEIIDKMIEVKQDINCSIYRDNTRYLRFEDEFAILSKKRTNRANNVVENLDELWKYPCPKVMFRVTEKDMEIIEPVAIKISNDRYRACKTQSTMMEFVHADANKGVALEAFCKNNNIDLKDVVGFGDMSNDNELLLKAGIGVCMINGSDDCKKCADVITKLDNNHDGCANYIEENILKEL